MELETGRLQIRPFTTGDITPLYLEALNDPEVMGMTEARHKHWTGKDAEDFILQANSKTSLLFGVFLKPECRPIGNIRLFDIHPIHKRAELSLLFYDKKEWGKGYATEAINAVVNYAFEELKLHRIVADYYATNTGSARMFAKTGFQQEGIFKDHFMTGDGRYTDSVRIARLNPNINQ